MTAAAESLMSVVSRFTSTSSSELPVLTLLYSEAYYNHSPSSNPDNVNSEIYHQILIESKLPSISGLLHNCIYFSNLYIENFNWQL